MTLTISQIRAGLARSPVPRLPRAAHRRAAVAMLLREVPGSLEMLFIERARRAADPWSGQMALPGGMVEIHDSGPRAAAERETAEEVGVHINASRLLGPLGEQQGRRAGRPLPIVVSCFVYHAREGDVVVPNEEVQDAMWVPLPHLLDESRFVEVRHPEIPEQAYPGVRISDARHQVVWGLTYRFLRRFFAIMSMPFPE